MSELLDELARSMARSMPRSKAVKLLGSALVTAAVPLLRAAPATGASRQRPPKCSDYREGPNCPKLCCKDCPGEFGGILKWCCSKGQECDWEAPSEAYRCGRVRCKSSCERPCGSKCCKPDEYCAHAKRGLCCKKGEDACLVLGAAGSGQAGSGGTCCTRGQKCCANDKRSACCAAKDSCCAGRCCPPDKVCTNGACRCPRGTNKCGSRECCKSGEKCCGERCCKKNQTCCGDQCCDSGETCCGDRCCGKGKTCCGGECCDKNEICMTTRSLAGNFSTRSGTTIRRTCCPKPRVLNSSYCCPPGTVVGRSRLTRTCCPSGTPHCCGELGCPPGEICVKGTCVGR